MLYVKSEYHAEQNWRHATKYTREVLCSGQYSQRPGSVDKWHDTLGHTLWLRIVTVQRRQYYFYSVTVVQTMLAQHTTYLKYFYVSHWKYFREFL